MDKDIQKIIEAEYKSLANIAVSGEWDLGSAARAMTALRRASVAGSTPEVRKLVDLIITQSDGLEHDRPDLFEELSQIVTRNPGYTRRSVHELVAGL